MSNLERFEKETQELLARCGPNLREGLEKDRKEGQFYKLNDQGCEALHIDIWKYNAELDELVPTNISNLVPRCLETKLTRKQTEEYVKNMFG